MLMDTINNLNDTLATLQLEINGLKTAKGMFDSKYTETWKEDMDNFVTKTEAKSEQHEFCINLLTNIAIKQEQRIDFLENKLMATYKREIKAN